MSLLRCSIFQAGMLVSLLPLLLLLPWPILSHSGPLITFSQPELTSMLSIAFSLPLWPSEALCWSGVFVLSTCSLLTFLGFYITVDVVRYSCFTAQVVWLLWSLLGWVFFSPSLQLFSTHSDTFLDFFRQFPASSMLPGAPCHLQNVHLGTSKLVFGAHHSFSLPLRLDSWGFIRLLCRSIR